LLGKIVRRANLCFFEHHFLSKKPSVVGLRGLLFLLSNVFGLLLCAHGFCVRIQHDASAPFSGYDGGRVPGWRITHHFWRYALFMAITTNLGMVQRMDGFLSSEIISNPVMLFSLLAFMVIVFHFLFVLYGHIICQKKLGKKLIICG
jgi:hypothetical protein